MNTLIYKLNSLGRPVLTAGANLNRNVAAAVGPRFSSTGDDTKPKTLALQDQLLNLPLPEIKDTISKFLLTAKPHLSETEYKTTAKKLLQLTEKNGIGEQLQSILAERRDKRINWFADWWLDMAYLTYRDPVVVWSSPGFAFPKVSFAGEEDRLEYTAKMLVGILDFKTMLDNQTLPVEFAGKQPIDMKTYYNLFGVNRVPGEPKDSLIFNPNSKHIIVAHNKNFFKLTVADSSGKWMNKDQMLTALKAIVNESNNLGQGAPVGGLTSDNRDNWAAAYKLLSANNANASSIQELETSLLVMCLDSDTSEVSMPDSMSKTALQSLHGFNQNFENRWFDKTLNFFVGSSGENGCISEHTPADGVVVMKIADHAMSYIHGKLSIDESPANLTPTPAHLPFQVSAEVQEYVEKAKAHIAGLIDDLQMRVMNFQPYGKNTIKLFKVSPDSWVQMAIQSAFYRTHGIPAATYESGGLRSFHEARTEVIRSCSEESVQFSKMMLNPQASDADKYNALMNAIRGHNTYARMATQGLGVDRHLQGMKMAALENDLPVPEIFSDPGYTRSARMRLSTSQISSAYGSFTCFGPLQLDGYGCCYSINKDSIIVSISSMKSNEETNSDTFHDNLTQSLIDMQQVCHQSLSSKL